MLILCVALLVILGLVASSFVILSHTQRASSRALSRADQLEQVRQMSLDYVRTLLLEDIVGNDGIFLNNDASDEAYDAPGGADRWLSAHGVTGGAVDTDNDGANDADWIISVTDPRFPDFANFASEKDPLGPSANIVAPDGTRYRVAIRIVDTNGLANINVGTALSLFTADARKTWDGQFPFCLYLGPPLLAGSDIGFYLDDGNGTVAGRIPGQSSDRLQALTYELYPHLANTDYTYLAGLPTPQDYIRPFDVAEELALRMKAGPDTDLHGRLGTLWPSTFSNNSDLLTAYSWTMQIRPTFSAAIETELTNLGYPGPCKIALNGLVGSDGLTVDDNTCKAVYLALVEAGMNANDAAQFLVNLVDYIDNDNIFDSTSDISVIGPGATADSVINFSTWTLPAGVNAPGSTYYGTDIQPIISEVYCQRVYKEIVTANPDGTFTYSYEVDDTRSRYAVELYNPSGHDISLEDWEINIGGAVDSIKSFTTGGNLTIQGESGNRADYFLTLMSAQPASKDFDLPGKMGWKLGWKITVPAEGALITVKVINPSGVVVDHFLDCDFKEDPPDSPVPLVPLPVIMEDFQRPGNDVDGDLIPAIVTFTEYESDESDPPVVLEDFPAEAISPVGQGGQIIVRNGPLHSLGELFYVPTVTNTTSSPALIVAMENQADGDSNYRLAPGSDEARDVLRNLTLRTGLYDEADNDGDGYRDDVKIIDGTSSATAEQIVPEARVPGLININTAPVEVIEALHYYYGPVGIVDWIKNRIRPGGKVFVSTGAFATFCTASAWPSKDEGDPDTAGVGSPDGITVDNEQKLFHFTNVANLVSVRSDVFVVYITIQASDRDGIFQPNERIMRTMAIVDRSFCLRPYESGLTAAQRLQEIPLPRIVAQTTLP